MSAIHLNDLFWTVQGEGANWGRRALFIRMPFCNLTCEWCDTSFNSKKDWTETDLILFAKQEEARFCVITGGEPTMHKHTERIIEIMNSLGFEIAIETNGNFPIQGGIDFITCSPKRQAATPFFVHPDNFYRVNEWKYVIEPGFDFSILDRHTGSKARKSLSPEFTDFKLNVSSILSYIKQNPEWRLNLQTHKWIGVP